jgi:hypothetical protein
MPARLSDALPRASACAAARGILPRRARAASRGEPRPSHTASSTWQHGSRTSHAAPHEPGTGQYKLATTQGNTRSAQQPQSGCSAGLTCYRAATRKCYPAPENTRVYIRIVSVNCVELWGFEPQTSCMPSSGNPSTRVSLCRSPSRRVHPGPPASRPVAVLSCCTTRCRYRAARDASHAHRPR